MAKGLLNRYSIGGDVIDRVPMMKDAPLLPPRIHQNSPETPVSAESPKGQGWPECGSGAKDGEAAKGQGRPECGSGAMDGEAAPAGEATGASDPPTPAATPAPDTPQDFHATKDGIFQVVTIGTIRYRIGGIKPLFVTSLRVNIRASSAEASYYDTLDLYSAKGRSGFALALHREWGVEPNRIDKDLVRILEHLEAERDKQLTQANTRQVIEVSEADRALGMALLTDPRLFDRIVDDLSTLGYVGEDLNKVLLYLCASSRKLDDPISVLILSQSASGKSFLVDSVKKLIPPEDVVAVTSLSDQALNYLDDLSHKFLVLGEAVHGDVVEHQIREMLSGKELSRMVAVKDPETGKLQSTIVRTPVIVASVMSGTNHAVNPENASRCFLVNTDESKEQTSRIHAHQRGKYSLERLKAGSDRKHEIIQAHQAAQRILEKRTIINNFAPLLDFPTSLMRLRRDHDRFLDLIACVCFLRQYQKPLQYAGDVSYIECDLEDYSYAYRIMVEGVMSSTVRELPKGAVVVYEEIRAWVREEAKVQGLKATEVSFTQRQVREATGLGHTWVKANLRQLVDYEYVVLAKGGNERSKAFYRLRADEDITRADLSMIPTPAVMRTLLSGGTQ